MKCETCGRSYAGGFCPGCDRPTCLPCLITVRLRTDQVEKYRHRCKTCAAAMALTEDVETICPTTA